MSYIKFSKTRALSIVWVCMLSLLFSANAQNRSFIESGNMLKLNSLPLLTGRFALEYERMLADRISLGAAVSIGPSRPLPFRSVVRQFAHEPILIDMIDGFRTSSFSVAPEVRFYTSRRGLFRGFYIAPYVQYATYGMSVPFEIAISEAYMGQVVYQREEDIRLSGRLSSFTAGISVGASFKLAEQWYLDWRIIGPGYGTGRSSISGNISLTPEEQQYLQEELGRLQNDLRELPFPIRVEPTVDNEGIHIRMPRSPWANLRAGLSIGYRF